MFRRNSDLEFGGEFKEKGKKGIWRKVKDGSRFAWQVIKITVGFVWAAIQDVGRWLSDRWDDFKRFVYWHSGELLLLGIVVTLVGLVVGAVWWEIAHTPPHPHPAALAGLRQRIESLKDQDDEYGHMRTAREQFQSAESAYDAAEKALDKAEALIKLAKKQQQVIVELPDAASAPVELRQPKQK